MCYATYEDYTAKYGGVRIPSARFAYYATTATAHIDRLTFGRISQVTEAITLCCCAICDLLCQDEQGLRSQSVGGYSVSYTERNIKKEIRSTANLYLGATGLLYRGVSNAQ